MIKKNGFTLAEALTALAIIGVVATICLPQVVTNTSEKQSVVAFKKAINTLSEAGEWCKQLEGFDYASLDDTNTLEALLRKRTAIDNISTITIQENNKDIKTTTITFKDGTTLYYKPSDTIKSDSANPAEIDEDGLPKGFQAILDINGKRGPNLISNCNGTKTGDSTGLTNDGSCTTSNLII